MDSFIVNFSRVNVAKSIRVAEFSSHNNLALPICIDSSDSRKVLLVPKIFLKFFTSLGLSVLSKTFKLSISCEICWNGTFMSNVFILLVRNNVLPGVLLTICLISGSETFLSNACFKSMLGTLFMTLADLTIGLGWAELHSRLNRNNHKIIRHFICVGKALVWTFLSLSDSLAVNKRQPDSDEVQSELTLNATEGEKVNSGLDSFSLTLQYDVIKTD
jgi:hypothetical protein